MKTKILTGLFTIVLILSFNCSKKSDNEVMYTDGYIVCHNTCSGDKEIGDTSENGYFVISENLKDTLLACNLLSNLFEFPSVFETSEHSYRYDYKIRFTYRLAEEAEKIHLLCPAIYVVRYPNAKQIIINTVSKL